MEDADSARSPADLAMDRYASGEDAAFAQVFDLVAPRLHAYFTRQVRDAAAADDLTQQTLLKMHRARGQFLKGAAVMPWAFAIGRRLMLDLLRRHRREAVVPVEAEVVEAEPTDLPSADALVEAQETARRIQKVLSRLPESQRVAFELVKQEGLSFAEAAEVLGTTVPAVKLRAHRAYEALRAVLGDLLATEGGTPT